MLMINDAQSHDVDHDFFCMVRYITRPHTKHKPLTYGIILSYITRL